MPIKKTVETVTIEKLSFPCPCGQQEMLFNSKPTTKGFRKFFCSACTSTLWLSKSAFEKLGEGGNIVDK